MLKPILMHSFVLCLVVAIAAIGRVLLGTAAEFVIYAGVYGLNALPGKL